MIFHTGGSVFIRGAHRFGFSYMSTAACIDTILSSNGGTLGGVPHIPKYINVTGLYLSERDPRVRTSHVAANYASRSEDAGIVLRRSTVRQASPGVARPLGKGHLEAQEAGGDLYIRGGNPGIGGDYPNDTKEGHVLSIWIPQGIRCVHERTQIQEWPQLTFVPH
ncbi:uncharacterized protein H6S33_007925 [Morchella sextelata]|uniref:uncharacterized protein n=1 Tax=Morchella sextelata TaxID=1174677 RepID=UPI001D0487C0|nr:uncharacterized protein H6S33_007925 [Morchella sextelata]KAH0602921.1 hypothetical protein H6S33_007925 [Morchella sextelata]